MGLTHTQSASLCPARGSEGSSTETVLCRQPGQPSKAGKEGACRWVPDAGDREQHTSSPSPSNLQGSPHTPSFFAKPPNTHHIRLVDCSLNRALQGCYARRFFSLPETNDSTRPTNDCELQLDRHRICERVASHIEGNNGKMRSPESGGCMAQES